MFNGTPVLRKDKTRSPVGNATETKSNAGDTFVAALAAWLADILRREGERLFLTCDEEANWRGWEITPLYGGLGRSYRDPRFDARHPDARQLDTLDEES